MKNETSELLENLGVLLTPEELRKVSGEIDGMIKDTQSSIEEIEKLDLKATTILAKEIENDTIFTLSGSVYPRVKNGGMQIPWLIITDQKNRQDVKDVTSGKLEEANEVYNTLLPHIERYRFVRGEMRKCFENITCQQLRHYLESARERIGYFYIKGKRFTKFWQTEFGKLREGRKLDDAYRQTANRAEEMEHSLLTKLEESCTPYEDVFFKIGTCRKNLQEAFGFCSSI